MNPFFLQRLWKPTGLPTIGNRRLVVRTVFALWILFLPISGLSATWFVAPDGSDSNDGSSNSPFATIMKAQSAASAGDTVYLRGGTYYLDNSNFTATNNPWAIINNMTKNGISYIAYPGERPVFDFSNAKPVGYRVTAFLVTANNCVFQGFDVVGVQVTIQTNHTQSECFRIAGGSNNKFIELRMHDGMANGWYLTDGASNLVLNCDAYNNRGLDSGSLGNTDGFGCHPRHTSGTGNVFRGCRAWFNSDDGYDCINAFAPVTFDHCWSFFNGYFTNFVNSTGDGNGFKSGGYGVSGGAYPTPIPRHVTEFCLSVGNRANGFYANHHLGGLDWFDNTAYGNAINYNMLCSTNNSSYAGDVPGYDQVMKNNLGYGARSVEVANLGPSNDVTFNYFTLPVTVTSTDFMTLDESLLSTPRQTNGDLPYIAFAQLTSGSDLVDAGTNIGFPFAGAAPDLGAFEYGLNPPPVLALTKSGTNFVLTGSGGPAGGTNYLVSADNLSVPVTQWTPTATNQFDVNGNFTMTNVISESPQIYYRLHLQ
jgi:Pel9A-like, right handed beta helix region